MAYNIIESPVTANQNVIGIDLSFNNIGLFKPLYTPTKQASANFRNLLQTQKGERWYHPQYGTDLIAIVFEPNVTDLKEDINNIIAAAATEWLPYININDIEIITNEDDPLMEHKVLITITISANSTRTEKIVIFVGENGNISIT